MNYRSDMLVRLLQTMDRRTNQDDSFAEENIIQDVFWPLSEELSLTDTVEVRYYNPSTFCWGGMYGISKTATWGSRTNVVL